LDTAEVQNWELHSFYTPPSVFWDHWIPLMAGGSFINIESSFELLDFIRVTGICRTGVEQERTYLYCIRWSERKLMCTTGNYFTYKYKYISYAALKVIRELFEWLGAFHPLFFDGQSFCSPANSSRMVMRVFAWGLRLQSWYHTN